MRALFAAAGLIGFALAGSAHAAVVYDTITGQTENSSIDSLVASASKNKGPLGDAYTPTTTQELVDVTLRLRNKNTVSDTGSVMLFLVPSTGSGASSGPMATGTALPSTGTSLPSKILLGTILDTEVPPDGTAVPNPSAFMNISLSTNVLLTAGTTYWFELVDSSDPVNGIGNSVSSMLKWGINSDVNGLGVPSNPNDIISYANSTDTGFVAYNSSDDSTPQVFEMQLTAVPEPSSLTLLGIGLLGMGLRRRWNSRAGS